MKQFSLRTPEQVGLDLAGRVRELRLTKKWKQSTLAKRSGVSLASLRRFETSGQISLQNLLKLAFALHRLDDFDEILNPPPAATLAELVELEDQTRQPKRKRGSL